jgi:hypothetical protein
MVWVGCAEIGPLAILILESWSPVTAPDDRALVGILNDAEARVEFSE